MRLIDADALIERIKYQSHEYERVRIDTVTGCLLTDFVSPTIDPVHAAGGCYCGECIYYKPYEFPESGRIIYQFYNSSLSYLEECKPDDFCSRGIPKNVQM